MDTPTSERLKRRQSDQILDGWTWGRVTKIGTALTVVGGIVVAVVTVMLTIIVTKPELKAVARKADSVASVTNGRLSRIEDRQDHAEAIHQLLVPMATLECVRLQREKSTTLAVIARLPCDSLLR